VTFHRYPGSSRTWSSGTGGRRLRLRLAQRWPWAGQIAAAVTRLQALPSG